MATPSVSLSAPLPLLGSADKVDSSTTYSEGINSINDFLIHQARTIPDVPLICYPATDSTGSEWAEYTAKDIDGFADEAAKDLSSQGLIPKAKRSTSSEVVALLGPSNFDYVVSLFALSRMGFTVMFLSTRLHTEAFVSLLEKTECRSILIAPQFADSLSAIHEEYHINSFPIPDKSIYARTAMTNARFERETELLNEEDCVSFVVHSSGSTGLPKPIFQTHRACLSNYALGTGMRAFITLPLFHNHGLCTLFRGMVSCKRTSIYSAGLPLTNANMVQAMISTPYESFHAVPYALKILSETKEGISALRKAKIVLFGGSSCPDELGDLLVREGVHVVAHYGATEMGQLMTSYRDTSDLDWNYLRPLAKVKPYLYFDLIGEGLYECVVLDGLPTKLISNCDDPPNSFRTRDTFAPHSTKQDHWKYIGRLDDRVTLVNGEKVLPIPYEHRIRQHELVQECLVFGVGRAFPGLLVIPSERAQHLSKAQVLQDLRLVIENANTHTEKFGKVPLEMVEVLDFGVDYPQTDKGTIIRAACYRKFANLIESLYVKFETPDESQGGLRKLDLPGIQEYLTTLFAQATGAHGLDADADFFDVGVDSLQAIEFRGRIMRELDVNGTILSNNVIFEHSTVRKLAQFLYSLSSGTSAGIEDEIDIMKRLVAKYSTFKAFNPGTLNPDGEVVLLTGATGSLGAHILSQLLPLPHIRHIYCLVRASSLPAARQRVIDALSSRNLPLSSMEKLFALPSDLGHSDLGLGPLVAEGLRKSLTTVIHSAWAVNFNIGVASFEAKQIAGLRNLLDLCLAVPFKKPARLAFVSSISAAAATPLPARVAETVVADPSHAQAMGYARSKWVAEHIVTAAAEQTGMDARVLRAGQMVGDSVHGMWNATEAIPLMLRTAKVLRALPRLDETPSWLPVDVCASACIELSGVGSPPSGCLPEADGPQVVYHLQNPTTFRWNEDLLPTLRDAGIAFEDVGQREWVQRLRDGEQDPQKNPAIKLLEFFATKYDNDAPGRRGLEFEMAKSKDRSPILDGGFDVIRRKLMVKCLHQWENAWES
ncbi:Fc.00g045870.m01.CDS01 [Cosmosporella sp. VM-42]